MYHNFQEMALKRRKSNVFLKQRAAIKRIKKAFFMVMLWGSQTEEKGDSGIYVYTYNPST